MSEPDKRAQEHIESLETDNDHLRVTVQVLEEQLQMAKAEISRLRSREWERD